MFCFDLLPLKSLDTGGSGLSSMKILRIQNPLTLLLLWVRASIPKVHPLTAAPALAITLYWHYTCNHWEEKHKKQRQSIHLFQSSHTTLVLISIAQVYSPTPEKLQGMLGNISLHSGQLCVQLDFLLPGIRGEY